MASMRTPKFLCQYPWVVVRLDCVLCPRRGTYRLARLAARYGPEQTLDGLLADLACDCPWWRTNPRRYEPRCGARFVDLERNLPPADNPATAGIRAREPGREDLPNRRSAGAGWSGTTPMLSTWKGDAVTIVCRRCDRTSTFLKTELLMNGGDAPLTALLKRLTADCPRATMTGIYEVCQAHFLS